MGPAVSNRERERDPAWRPDSRTTDELNYNKDWNLATNWIECAQDPKSWKKYVDRY